MSTVHWPEADWKLAKDLLGRGVSVVIAAHQIGVKAANLRAKIRWENMTPAQKEARRVRINAHRKSRAFVGSEARYQPEPASFEKAPAHVLEERIRRQAIQRCPIEELLGVPPPGYSALDRKLAGELA